MGETKKTALRVWFFTAVGSSSFMVPRLRTMSRGRVTGVPGIGQRTRIGCHDGRKLRMLALPRNVKHWSMTTLRDKLIRIGAKVVNGLEEAL